MNRRDALKVMGGTALTLILPTPVLPVCQLSRQLTKVPKHPYDILYGEIYRYETYLVNADEILGPWQKVEIKDFNDFKSDVAFVSFHKTCDVSPYSRRSGYAYLEEKHAMVSLRGYLFYGRVKVVQTTFEHGEITDFRITSESVRTGTK